jgi:hypothetical protein
VDWAKSRGKKVVSVVEAPDLVAADGFVVGAKA